MEKWGWIQGGELQSVLSKFYSVYSLLHQGWYIVNLDRGKAVSGMVWSAFLSLRKVVDGITRGCLLR